MQQWSRWERHYLDGRPVQLREYPLVRSLLDNETVRAEQYRIERHDGTIRYVTISSNPIYDQNGIIVGAIVAIDDITNKVKVDEELIVSRNRLDAILRQMPDGILIFNSDGLLIGYNNEVARLMEITTSDPQEALIAWRRWQTCAADGSPSNPDTCPLQLAFRQGITSLGREMLMIRDDGKKIPIIVSCAPVRNDVGKIDGYVATFQDITQLHKLQENCLIETERLRQIISNCPVAIIVIDNHGIITHINQYMEDIVSPNIKHDLIGKHYSVCAEIAGQGIEISMLGRALKGEIAKNISTNVRERELLISMLPLHVNGVLVGAIGVYHDVSDMKKYELELLRLDRLNIVGEMAAGIGHEVRNPMTTVRGYLQLLENKQDLSKYRDKFEMMIQELDRANSIIREFLTMAKDKQLKAEIRNLNKILTNLEPLLQAEASLQGHLLELETGDTYDLVIDENEIRQLVLNLVRNGFEAMTESGTLKIKTLQYPASTLLEVTDQGKGIPPEVQSKIGKPFFTTKETGTGLGLSVCYAIADRHGAKMSYTTGHTGTTFTVSFPNKLIGSQMSLEL